MPSLFDRCPPIEASRGNGFSGNALDRLSEARAGLDLAALARRDDARLLLFCGERALVAFDGDRPSALLRAVEAETLGVAQDATILLGFEGTAPWFAAEIAAEVPLPAGVKAIDLRSLAVQGLLGTEELGAIAQGRALFAWHAANRFCGRCGHPSGPGAGGLRRLCTGCGAEHFPRVDPVVIMLAIRDDRCLLGRQPRFLLGIHSCLAGFVEPGETIEAAVRREIREEAGIAIGRVLYHSSQPWPFPSSLMIGCHAEALDEAITRDEAELEECRWFARDEVRLMIDGRHAEGLGIPPAMAIANRLIAAFVEGG